MSLSMLLHSSDDKFEKSVGEMSERELIGIMHEVIGKMDSEQKRFDLLSSRLDQITDQASAEFKEVSCELVKSQNILSLLMSRNMFCFNLQSKKKGVVEPEEDILMTQTKPASSSVHNTAPIAATAKKKVVKVTRVITSKKVSETDEGLDPQLKSIMESRRNHIKNYTNPSKKSSNDKDTVNNTETVSPQPTYISSLNSLTLSGHSNGASSSSSEHDQAPVTNINDVDITNGMDHSGTAPGLVVKQSTTDSTALSDTDTATSSETAIDLAYDFNSNDFKSEKVKERVFLKSWNPVKILDELYAVKLAKESKSKEVDSSSYLSIMGGVLEEMPRMIGIDDKRGHYLMVRCPSELEHRDWLRSLYTQLRCSPAVGYIRPTLTSADHPSKVVVIDLGSCSVRAGILSTTPCYPRIFMPCITTTDSAGGKVFGADCYHPDNRIHGLHYPVATNKKVDKYRVNVHALEELFSYIFDKLGASPSEHTLMLSTPHNFSTGLKQEVLNVLFTKLGLVAVNMVNQSLLTPYIYNATSGVVVDIGQRIEIVAITDGYLVEGGLQRLSYGGAHITDNLNSCLMEYRLHTPAEYLITRLIKERTCFISQDYEDDLLECMTDSSRCQATVNLSKFDFPEGAHIKLMTVDAARFKAPEGLIKSELLGVDSPTLPQLIQQIILKCPMDSRREMWQSIYLSGGTTLLEGFPERLEAELNKITPPSVSVQVHTSAHRYHAAFIGACMLARLPNFKQSCITREEWASQGKSSLNKWKHYFQGT